MLITILSKHRKQIQTSAHLAASWISSTPMSFRGFTPSCGFSFVSCAEPSSSALVHFNVRVGTLALNVINSLSKAGDVPLIVH